MDLVINDCRLNVEVLGEKGKPVLIGLHGGGGIGSLDEPKQTFGALADLFHVVVFDMRGCGKSEGVPPYSHEQWAADVDAIRHWLGAEKVVVAGGSYGGFISLEYAVRYPDRVSGIILRDTSPDNQNFETLVENAKVHAEGRVTINWDNFHRYWEGKITSDQDLKERWAELIPLYDKNYDAFASAAKVEAGFYRYEAHNACMSINKPNYDVKPFLPKITAPTLITVGRHDWVTPVASSETIHRLIPNSELVIFENSGHSPQSEEGELFQKTLRSFISAHHLA